MFFHCIPHLHLKRLFLQTEIRGPDNHLWHSKVHDFAMKNKDALISEIRSRTKYFFFKEFEGSIKEYDELLFSMENRIMAKADSIYNSPSEETEKKMFTSFLKSKLNIDYKAGCG